MNIPILKTLVVIACSQICGYEFYGERTLLGKEKAIPLRVKFCSLPTVCKTEVARTQYS